MFLGTVVAIYTLGCLIGALASIAIGNSLGRRRSLIIFAIIAAIGTILQGTTFSLGQLIVGRIVSGLGVGGVNAVVPVWQAECSKPKNRGKNVVILGTFVASGIAIAAWVNVGLSFHQKSSVCWRLPLSLPFFFCILICLGVFCFPESPRWLVQKGRHDDARSALSILNDIPVASEHISQEIEIMQRAWNAESSRETGFLDLLSPSRERLQYRTFLAIIINFCAQMTGANVITYYASTIFRESLQFATLQSSLLAAGLLTWKIFAAVLAYYFVDRVGRKPLFMVAGGGMGLSMMCLAITVSQISKSSAAGPAAVVFLFMFMAFFPIGFLGANFLYSTEIAPQHLRIHLSAIGTAAHWLFNFVIAEVTPVAFTGIGFRYYIVYACTGFAVIPLVYFLFPETNGRSLEDMDRIFSRPEHWWQIAGAACERNLKVERVENSSEGCISSDDKYKHSEHVEKIQEKPLKTNEASIDDGI
ncbi:sugar transporter [Tricladium varicosporioides]|nr:sugar transporter [Hymenoscyphus varicosporioides]